VFPKKNSPREHFKNKRGAKMSQVFRKKQNFSTGFLAKSKIFGQA
jgi:hypothetical protein